MGYSNKTWCCPFFKRDERMSVHCEGGQVRFDHWTIRNLYINQYCASVSGWEMCTIAKSQLWKYEKEKTDV